MNWETATIADISETSSGTTPPRAMLTRYYTGGKIAWVKTLDLNNSEIYTTDEMVTIEALNETSLRLNPEGTVLVAMYGGFNQIGRTGLLRIPAAVNQAILAIKSDKAKLDSGFLLATLNYNVDYWKSVASSSRKDPNITSRDVREFQLILPPLDEQRRIAEALSDTDTLISAMEKLIAKKRAIKQGAMQELLTGKRRLPGFEEKWEEKKIIEFGDVITGSTPSTAISDYWGGVIPWVTPTDISSIRDISKTERQITDSGLSVIRELPPNTLLVTCIASIGKNAILRKRGASNQQINAIVPYVDTDVNFLYYLIEFNKGYLLDKAGQTATKILSKSDFSDMTFAVPEKVEQIAIAELLSDMDAEIDALAKKLYKLLNIKQGMMNELLTGRIRLLEQDTKATLESVSAAKAVDLPTHKSRPTTARTDGHNQQFDDAVMIAGIVNVLYSDGYPLGRKRVQKCLYLLRRYQDESTAAFKKKAAGPYADEIRYKGGEPIAKKAKYITTTTKGKGTSFARGCDINKALAYIQKWEKQADIAWVANKLKYKRTDDLELLATVDMAICELSETGTPISVDSIKHLINTNKEWKAKLKMQTFSDMNISRAIHELQTLFQGGN